jgi:hypothetical protein
MVPVTLGFHFLAVTARLFLLKIIFHRSGPEQVWCTEDNASDGYERGKHRSHRDEGKEHCQSSAKYFT